MFCIVFCHSFAFNINTFDMKYIKHSPTKKDIKIWIAFFLIIVIPIFLGFYLEPKSPILLMSLFLILGFFIFNLIIRKSLSFKRYFTSPYNFLTSKIYFEKSFDIPKELMFEKLIEVLKGSNFKLTETDKQRFQILAITSISLKSWGENLYISIESFQNKTIMKFSSVTLFQIYDWGKNEKNYYDLLQQIESSLIV